MNTKGSNRSVQRTKKLLKNALSELLLKKTLHEISVRELCEHANLNRGTFYLHYKDIYDLLEQMEDDLLADVSAILSSHETKELKGKPFPLLKDLFLMLEKNEDFCRVLIREMPESRFMDKLQHLARERCFRDWTILFAKKDAEHLEIYYSYFLSGFIGIIKNWLLQENRLPPEKIAALSEDFILNGMNALR